MSDISLSKFPEGKVLMWQMYVPLSETSVPMMTRDESTVGSLLLKRTRPDHVPNAANRDRDKEKKGERSRQSVKKGFSQRSV